MSIKLLKQISIVFIFLSLAVFLFTFRLGNESIWNDEWLTLSDISCPDICAFFSFVKVNEDTPPVYFLLLRWWSLNGRYLSIEHLRMFSVVWAIAGLAGVYLLAKSLNGKRTALISSILYMASPYVVWYAQEARNVMMEGALSVIIMYFFNMFVQKGSKKYLFISCLLLILGLYTHYFFLFLIPAQLIYISIYRRDLFRIWLICAVVVMLAFFPWVPVVISQLKIARISWLECPTLYFPVNLFAAFSTGLFYKINSLWTILSVGLYILFFIAGFLCMRIRDRELDLSLKFTETTGFMIIFFFTPLILSYGVSFFKPILYDGKRYLMLILPLFFIITASGINRVSRQRLIFFSVAILLCFNSYFLKDLYRNLQKRPWDKVAYIMRENSMPGDVLYSVDYSKGKILDYYGIGDIERVDVPDIKQVKKVFRGHNRAWFIADVDNSWQQKILDGLLPVIFSRMITNSAGLQIRLTLYDTAGL